MIQDLINTAISNGSNYVKIPDGVYTLDKGLIVGNADFSFLESFVIEGTIPGYGGAKGVKIIVPDNSFGIAFQRCKGFRLRNVYFEGENKLWRYSPNEILFGNIDWNNGCQSYGTAPHCAIAMDPFHVSVINRYAGFDQWYANPYNAGSTDGVIKDCSIRYFVDGFTDQPSGISGNGDCIKIEDCWIDYCKYGISTGNHQNRSIHVNNLKSWGAVHTLFNTRFTGGGTGCPPEIDGLNIAGCLRNLCALNSFDNNNGITMRRVHAEMLASLGGCDTPHGRMTISDSFINMVPGCDIIFTGESFTAINSTLTYYGSPIGSFQFDAYHVSLSDCKVDVMPKLANKQVRGRIIAKAVNRDGYWISDNETIIINVDSNDATQPYLQGQNIDVIINSNYNGQRRLSFKNDGYYENGNELFFFPNECTAKTKKDSNVLTDVSLSEEWRWQQFREGIYIQGVGKIISKDFNTKTITVDTAQTKNEKIQI